MILNNQFYFINKAVSNKISFFIMKKIRFGKSNQAYLIKYAKLHQQTLAK